MDRTVLDVIASLRELSSQLDRLDEAAATHYGLNRTDMRALDILGREGPLAPTDLAHRVGFTTGGITTVIDRLERAGYVVRRPDQSDRRRLLIEVTDATRQRDRGVFGGLMQLAEAIAAGYKDRDLQTIRRFIDEISQATASYAATLSG
jgi:DNA-binding MarR family transcriptional regulator